MLKRIPKLLSPQLLKVLCEMGHGDEIVLADGNFPSESMGANGVVVRADGLPVPELLDAILTVLPLDSYVEKPVALMGVVPGDPCKPDVWETYKAILAKNGEDPQRIEWMERFAFYERAKKAYAIVATGGGAHLRQHSPEKGCGQMKNKATVLAFDLGASSGRAIRGVYDSGSFSWEELHRFENNPAEKDGHFRWNFGELMREIRVGIDKAGAFDSVAFDTWGVDFGLLDASGRLLADPVHYRDGRTDGILGEALRTMDGETLYGETGTQLLQINTLFQLLALQKQEPETLRQAKKLLLMPDLFASALCGAVSSERSAASTAQLLRLPQGEWSQAICRAFGLPEGLLPPLAESGAPVGKLPENGALVLATAGHDTQCAVAALPDPAPDAAFLSCGTWSLLGCELDAPILTPESMRLGLSNEWGANGKINYLKNIIGLWLIQESRRAWKRTGESYSYADLERLALAAEPLRCFIDPG